MNSVTVRMALYILSTLLTTFAAQLAGFGVNYDPVAGVLAIHVETLVGAVIAATGLSAAVFARWGVSGRQGAA